MSCTIRASFGGRNSARQKLLIKRMVDAPVSVELVIRNWASVFGRIDRASRPNRLVVRVQTSGGQQQGSVPVAVDGTFRVKQLAKGSVVLQALDDAGERYSEPKHLMVEWGEEVRGVLLEPFPVERAK